MDKLIHRISLTTQEMQVLLNGTADKPECREIRTKIGKALEVAKAEELERARESDQFADLLRKYFPQPET